MKKMSSEEILKAIKSLNPPDDTWRLAKSVLGGTKELVDVELYVPSRKCNITVSMNSEEFEAYCIGQRTLWLTRAKLARAMNNPDTLRIYQHAHPNSYTYPRDANVFGKSLDIEWHDRWWAVECKCKEKADEYDKQLH